MQPLAMGLVLVLFLGLFGWSARRRWRLLASFGAPREAPVDDLLARLQRVLHHAGLQPKLRKEWPAGVAHNLIFAGFLVLLARTLVLWGRGFDPDFALFVLGAEQPLGQVYTFLKDTFAILVIAGAAVFFHHRVIAPKARMSHSREGVAILGIIVVMMVADLVYDGAALVLASRHDAVCAMATGDHAVWCGRAATIIAPFPGKELGLRLAEPGGSTVAWWLSDRSTASLVVAAEAGFWTHAVLVLVFLNLLPYSKHFHIITAGPNVFFGALKAPGRLPPLARSSDALLELVEQASEADDLLAAPVGHARLSHLSWKDVLDAYTCTECGRCSDQCPAHGTGKKLSPKGLILTLRDQMYERQEAVDAGEAPADPDLVPAVVDPDVLWACTTCRACEEECPVDISHVDRIVEFRRSLVQIRGELFPSALNGAFDGMETNGNPWNLARVDRASWATGLDVPTLADRPDAEVLFWVGCAPSYDDRARKTARAFAQLLRAAGVDFAILGEEETCTGDSARRAGNEYLFATLAEENVATINGYREQGGARTIVTTCPHCFNTLAHEYPDFGGAWDVRHHTAYLLELLEAERLTPSRRVAAVVSYHDSCYLGRYNDEYDAPRAILQRIPGVELREVVGASRERGLCCGAGGAQMWVEEQNDDRINVKRTRQLVGTGADTVASACPFCMTMLTDGLKATDQDAVVKNRDVVELLAESCGVV